MIAELDVKALSKVDKLRLLEALWADLTGDGADPDSPPWHQQVLEETDRLHAEGKASFSDWGEAKARVRAAVSAR